MEKSNELFFNISFKPKNNNKGAKHKAGRENKLSFEDLIEIKQDPKKLEKYSQNLLAAYNKYVVPSKNKYEEEQHKNQGKKKKENGVYRNPAGKIIKSSEIVDKLYSEEIQRGWMPFSSSAISDCFYSNGKIVLPIAIDEQAESKTMKEKRIALKEQLALVKGDYTLVINRWDQKNKSSYDFFYKNQKIIADENTLLSRDFQELMLALFFNRHLLYMAPLQPRGLIEYSLMIYLHMRLKHDEAEAGIGKGKFDLTVWNLINNIFINQPIMKMLVQEMEANINNQKYIFFSHLQSFASIETFQQDLTQHLGYRFAKLCGFISATRLSPFLRNLDLILFEDYLIKYPQPVAPHNTGEEKQDFSTAML